MILVTHVEIVKGGGYVTLYEGNSQTQNVVCEVNLDTQKIKFSSHECDNDEARSIAICYATIKTKLRFYDDPDGDKGDDYTEIEVKKYYNGCLRTVTTFEDSPKDDYLDVTYHSHNGLDGKVSRLEIDAGTPTKAPVKFIKC